MTEHLSLTELDFHVCLNLYQNSREGSCILGGHRSSAFTDPHLYPFHLQEGCCLEGSFPLGKVRVQLHWEVQVLPRLRLNGEAVSPPVQQVTVLMETWSYADWHILELLTHPWVSVDHCVVETLVTRILPSEITNSSLQFHYNFQSSKSITDTIPFWTDTEEFLASTLPSKSSYQSIDCMRFHFLLDRWITHNVPFSFQSCEDDEKQYLLM